MGGEDALAGAKISVPLMRDRAGQAERDPAKAVRRHDASVRAAIRDGRIAAIPKNFEPDRDRQGE